MAHTPGPWSVEGMSVYAEHAPSGAYPFTFIAEVKDRSRGLEHGLADEPSGADPVSAAANARLIAAAPDLVAFVERVARCSNDGALVVEALLVLSKAKQG